jgi:hypothetical protein
MFTWITKESQYRVSTMKRPDFGEFLKRGKWFFSGLMGFLRTTGVQIPAKIFMLPHGPPLGRCCLFTQKWGQLRRRRELLCGFLSLSPLWGCNIRCWKYPTRPPIHGFAGNIHYGHQHMASLFSSYLMQMGEEFLQWCLKCKAVYFTLVLVMFAGSFAYILFPNPPNYENSVITKEFGQHFFV